MVFFFLFSFSSSFFFFFLCRCGCCHLIDMTRLYICAINRISNRVRVPEVRKHWSDTCSFRDAFKNCDFIHGILSSIFFYKITCEFTYSDKWRWNFFHFHWIWIWENNVHLSKELTSCCVISQRVYGLLSLASPYFTLTHCYNKFSKQVEKIDEFASIATIFSTKMPCSVWCSIYYTMKYSIYPRLSFIFPFQYQVNTLLTADTHAWHVCALPPYYARWYAHQSKTK